MSHMNLPNTLLLYLQPVLDIKPYLPYSDSVKGAAIPNWLEVLTTPHLCFWHALVFLQLICITFFSRKMFLLFI